jgi:hypothetical protein
VKDEPAEQAKEQSLLESIIGCGPSWNNDETVDAAEHAREEKEREEEERRLKREARASKKKWRVIREERFKFLDSAVEQIVAQNDFAEDNDADYP